MSGDTIKLPDYTEEYKRLEQIAVRLGLEKNPTDPSLFTVHFPNGDSYSILEFVLKLLCKLDKDPK